MHNQKVTRVGLEPRVMVGGYEVAPESVGLWTGLKDKNGKDIFAGDRIMLECVGVFYVRYSTTMCQFALHGKNGFIDALKELQVDRYEVIGNVYQNKELLEK